ncbi:seizure protein 6 homolog [Brienomyrus brachyistius]|uniref:seizure protein 6 homolog n=1 Tax=Brienomyrus brachyistius TaxID=42636 RepID=UPI0020B291E7|nr:seizure protein 6 homolog [Brienomyrus brachyistius]
MCAGRGLLMKLLLLGVLEMCDGGSSPEAAGQKGSVTGLETDCPSSSLGPGTSPAGPPSHRPLLRGLLLHQALLTKDFRGDQSFLDGLVGSPVSSQTVPHEDAPAFSDVATTTVTMVTASLQAGVVTAPVSTAPGRAGGEGSPPATTGTPVTTDFLTTPVTHASLSPDTVVTPTSLAPPILTTPSKELVLDPEDVAMGKSDGLVMTTTPQLSLQDVPEKSTAPTTVTTPQPMTEHPAVACGINLTAPDSFVKVALRDSASDCTYSMTVYLGYGVEIQVLEVNLLPGDTATLDDLGATGPSLLANESILTAGLVLQSRSNQVSIRFQGKGHGQQAGSFLLHYQAFVLSCPFPQRPAQGDVSVTSLHAGGEAYFYCLSGYQLHGPPALTCRNATTPYWSGKEPRCQASCGGVVRNATIGRIASPGFPASYDNNLTCHWVVEAPEDHRLHIHFEKVALAEDDDRLLIKDGDNIDSPLLYDSYEVEYLPSEGVVSSSRCLFVEFNTDGSGTSTGAAVRYEAFAQENCYEPFLKHGNFSSSDPTFAVGAVVEFSCEAGYTLEQGSVTIECVAPNGPQWNETEPACRAVCSGDITDSTGVVLSPNWPETYDRGQDCIWGIHVEEDKRIMLDVQVLRLGRRDQLTFYDGDDLTANILGQYSGPGARVRLYTSTADVTLQFQSDPAGDTFAYGNGFVVRFFEVPRNDTCPELPEIANGWKSTSHPELVHGTVVTYQCYPGFQLWAGAEVLMCQWDLTWSGDVPSCQRVTWCSDPGAVQHSRRVTSGAHFAVGATVQYVCDKGYVMTGDGTLTCHARDAASPKWSGRPPKCVPEKYEPCRAPGTPRYSIQSTEKQFYQAGETLLYNCLAGYQLQGDATIRCIPGHPSQWSGPPPVCREPSSDSSSKHQLDASSAVFSSEWANVGVAILAPAVVFLAVIVGIYIYFSKFQGKSLRLPLSSTPPYDNMTESAFDNPIYETGDSREYEVSI